MPPRVGLYSPKPKATPEQLAAAEKLYPRPQVDIEFELGQVAIIRANLQKPVVNTTSTGVDL